MRILGNPESGWFAKLAHGVEWVGRKVFGNGVYDSIHKHVDATVENSNQKAIDQARAKGATPHQALDAGSAAMESIANPKDASDFGKIATTVAKAVPPVIAEQTGLTDFWDKAIKLLSSLFTAIVGALIVGGGLAALGATLGGTPLAIAGLVAGLLVGPSVLTGVNTVAQSFTSAIPARTFQRPFQSSAEQLKPPSTPPLSATPEKQQSAAPGVTV